MKDKILEIISKYKDLDCYYDFLEGNKEKALENKASLENIATEIADMGKDFTEWLAFKSHGNFNPKFELHKYWDGTVNEWRTIFRKFDGLRWIDITIDELFNYWYDNIKDK